MAAADVVDADQAHKKTRAGAAKALRRKFLLAAWSTEVKSFTTFRLDSSGVCLRLAREPASVGSFSWNRISADSPPTEEIGENRRSAWRRGSCP